MKFLRRTYLYLILVPLLLIGIGASSNQLVFMANHDSFPTLVNEARVPNDVTVLMDGTVMIDQYHCLMTDKTHLNILADRFDFQDEGTESIGDLSIDLGGWLWQYTPIMWFFAIIRRLFHVQ